MRAITEQQKQEAIAAFAYEGTLIADTVYGSGHINDTFRLTFAVGNMGDLDVILQRMNADAFPHPEQLMENIAGVTGFLKKKIIARGGDPERETLNIIPTVDNKPYYRDTNGDYWRSYRFITGASSFDQVETPQQFYESAVAFGSFQRLLADYPAETLHETIPGFHDTRARFAAFEKAVREDVVGRAAEVQKEIAFFLERKETACYFAGRLDRGELPIRVTHNDTKLNNVMLDDKTGKGVCVIDLDTVMPGLAMNDFGDAIRYGASTAAEDERDLSEVSCSMELFSLFTKGFLEGCGGSLTPEETALLPMGAKVMTYECGMRFLMDYLQGDRYFKIHRDGQNLDRDRTADRLHFHNYMELGYCYYGAGDVVLGDDTYCFSGQQFTVIPSNFPHTTNSDPGNISRWEYLFVDVEVVLDGIFPDNALRKERALQRLYEKPWFLEEAEYPKEAAKIKEILNIMRKGDEFYLEEAKALLGCLLLEITRLNYTNKETRADAEQGRITCIVSRAMDYISDHYMEPIRVEQLAKYSHLSETHFRRVFTEYMHMGPLEYINTVRIRTACEHLKKTEEPVADIAHKCGFTTNSTFNRNFKQMMGVTPVEWRKRPENYEQRLLNYEIHTEKGW